MKYGIAVRKGEYRATATVGRMTTPIGKWGTYQSAVSDIRKAGGKVTDPLEMLKRIRKGDRSMFNEKTS